MKKILSIIFILAFLFTGCSKPNLDGDIEEINIAKPKVKNPITGIWKIDREYTLNTDRNSQLNELFISNEVYQLGNTHIINPIISARYVNYKNYFSNKGIKIPKELQYKDENIVVYRLSNEISYSQEFLELSENELLTIDIGNIIVFKKSADLTSNQINEKFKEVSEVLEGKIGIQNMDFGLSVAFRKRIKYLDSFPGKYEYMTYFIKSTKSDLRPDVFAVNNIVIPKDSGLWTVMESIGDVSEESFNTYKVSSFPTFNPKSAKSNTLNDTIYRRIDYVNDDYIGVTKLIIDNDPLSESFEIHPIHSIAKRTPLKVTTIAGTDGNQEYLRAIKDSLNLIKSADVIPITPDYTNIGLQRKKMSWGFVSSLNFDFSEDETKRIYKSFDLNIIPTINLGTNYNSKITWREVINKVPTAIDAIVSPDENYILIQSYNMIQLFPIYYNNIAVNPLFSIQNTFDYEIVMSKWITGDKIKSVYEDYKKLSKINSQIIYP